MLDRRTLVGGAVGLGLLAGAVIPLWRLSGGGGSFAVPETASHGFERVKRLSAPKPLPLTIVHDVLGQAVPLPERVKGAPAVINFWATWCTPCIREMPALDRFAELAGGRGVVVLAVSQDRGGATVAKEFLDKERLTRLEALADADGNAGRAWGVRGLPTTLFLDAEGWEVARLEGMADWDAEAAWTMVDGLLRGAELPKR